MQTTRYHPLSAALHWLMFILIAVALVAIQVREEIPKGEPLRDTLKSVHMLAGQLVFLFVLVRLALRLALKAPAALPGPRWQTGSAHLVHLVLYLMMLGLPLSGVLFYQAGGRDVSFFGMLLPQLIAPNPELKSSIKEIHETVGEAIYFVVGFHVLAALWHHFIVKDGTMLRMLPWKK